jgi:RHS repeat-associated protein
MSIASLLHAQSVFALSFKWLSSRLVTFSSFMAILVCASTPAFADDMTGRAELGVSSLATQAASGIDNVNLQNGNVSMQLPLGSLPQFAGGKLSYTLYAYYNSALWKARKAEYVGENGQGPCPVTYSTTDVVAREEGGWKVGGQYEIIFRDAHEDFDYVQPMDSLCGGDEFYLMDGHFFKPILKMPDGSEHEMRINGSFTSYGGNHEYLAGYYKSQTGNLYNPFTSAVRMYTVDGSYIAVDYGSDGSYGIYLKDGTVVTPATVGQRISDRNGNSILLSSGSGYDFAEDEATGRRIRWSTTTYSGSLATKVEYQSVGGTWQSVYVVWGTTTVEGILYYHRDWNIIGGLGGYGGTCNDYSYITDTAPVVRSIVLPNTELSEPAPQFSFAYNSDTSATVSDSFVSMDCGSPGTVIRTASDGMGEISEITMPSGAVINYSYHQDGHHKMFGTVDSSGDNAVSDPLETKTIAHDGVSPLDTWTYSTGVEGADVTNPDSSTYEENRFSLDPLRVGFGGASGQGGLTYRTIDNNRVMTERHWTLLGGTLYSFGSFPSAVNPNRVSYNPVVDTEFTTLLDTDGTTRLKMTAKSYNYDYNGELLSTTEYDWINLSSVSYDSTTGIPTGVPSGTAVLRISNNSYYNTASSSAGSTAYQIRTLGSSPVILGKVKQSTVGTGTTTKSDTKFSYDNNSWGTAPGVGNLTKVSAYNDTTSSWIDTASTYDSKGNVTSAVDGNANTTAITYGCINGASTCSAEYKDLYPTQVEQASGTGVASTIQTEYDFYTGLATSLKDYDNNVTTTTEYDIKLRPILVTNADGSTLENQVRTDYHDYDRFIVTMADLVTAGDAKKVATQFFDQLGRVRLSKVLENASTQSATNETEGIKVETKYTYTTGYSWQLTSNPFRASSSSGAGSEETMGWTRTKSWITGHQSQVETFSGASMPAPWGSNSSATGIVNKEMVAANVTEVTDQASKVRRSITDSLGRLERLDEPTTSGLGSVTSPNQATSYAYDVLNNLTGVTQGSQSRSFSYNSLGRLTSAVNPESGTISYGYDSNGNLTSKTDARGIVTSSTYDALNRVTQRAYASPSPSPVNYQTTPTVTYTYDDKTNAKGKLTKVSSSVSTTEYTSFDVLGRVTGHKQTTSSTDFNTSYTYNLAGQLLTETYPSGRVVQNTFATNGDLSQVQTKPSSGSYTNRASSFVYNPTGAVQSLQLGNSKYETTHFNQRLQPTQIGLGTSTTDTSLLKLEYSYDATANNGNVTSQTITVPGMTYPLVQSYTYDELNRLASATETSNLTPTWTQVFGYDRYGNRNITSGTGQTSLTFGSTTNRITTSGYSYDSAGNTTADPSANSFTYDGEKKQVLVKNGSRTQGTYYYDGDGKRVKKTAKNDNIIFIYDASGRLIEERSSTSPYTLQSSYVYAGGRLLSKEAEPSTSTTYLTTDHLGSPRINTDGSGNVVARHDYHPFGEEIDGSGGRTTGLGYVSGDDGIRQQFTKYETDLETDLDFAQARMYSSNLGRFTTVDRASSSAKSTSPMSWNGYVYVQNNPLMYTDPTGLIWVKESECASDECRPIWIADNVWEEMSDGEQGDYEIWTEMEYDSVDGRIRLDPTGPSAGNKGWERIGSNLGNPGYLKLGTAAVVSQVDSPVPGPADVIAIAIAAFGLYEISLYAEYGVPFNYDPNLYSVSKDNKKLVGALVVAAEAEIEKLKNDPAEFGPRNHHKGEIKAMLDRAKKIADRLKGKTKEAAKEMIKQLEETVQDIAPDN